jgi:ATP-dependent HslUV protease ATP-binding subunit HslU
MPSFEIPGMPGANVGMINISDVLGKSMGQKPKKKKMSVKESHEILINEESDKLIEQDKIIKAAKNSTENNGIVFLDEIDKISQGQIELEATFQEKVFKEIYYL